MKKRLIPIILFFVSRCLFAQNSNCLQVAYIKNNIFYTPQFSTINFDDSIVAYDLKNIKGIKFQISHFFSKKYGNIVWDICNNLWFENWGPSIARNELNLMTYMEAYALKVAESKMIADGSFNEFALQENNKTRQRNYIFDVRRYYYQERIRSKQTLFNRKKWVQQYYRRVIDFKCLDTTKMIFFERDDYQLSVWLYNYWGDNEQPGRDTCWKRLITYSNDTTELETYMMSKSYIAYFEPNVKYRAIKDTLFFKGVFKGYINNGNMYIINKTHGGIYYLADSTVEKIGQIDINNYKKIKDNYYLIEDKDNNRLIIPSQVTKYNNKYPFPPIITIKNEDELYKLFKKYPIGIILII